MNDHLSIRRAHPNDIEQILKIYQSAREFMIQHGNPTQWKDQYPRKELLEADIQAGHLFVCSSTESGLEKNLCGVFCFISGPDPTYQIIEEGNWLSDHPYHVIHRLASDGSKHGIARACFNWSFLQDKNIRVDTHANNLTMQALLDQYGFTRCGIIYVEDGSPRIAYQKEID